MRRIKKAAKAGFTLVELMIVVAIIGVLAALAIYGVSKYLDSAKSGEAKTNVGAMTKAAVAAYDGERSANQLLADGGTGTMSSHALCPSAPAVPTTLVVGSKYQPSTVATADFNATTWQCLNFAITQPIYFQYAYTSDSAGTAAAPGTAFLASAVSSYSSGSFNIVSRGGVVRLGQVVLETQIQEDTNLTAATLRALPTP